MAPVILKDVTRFREMNEKLQNLFIHDTALQFTKVPIPGFITEVFLSSSSVNAIQLHRLETSPPPTRACGPLGLLSQSSGYNTIQYYSHHNKKMQEFKKLTTLVLYHMATRYLENSAFVKITNP